MSQPSMSQPTGEQGWEYAYERELASWLENLRDALEEGEGRDLGTYQFLCGRIRGIRDCIARLTSIRERFRQDDDQD